MPIELKEFQRIKNKIYYITYINDLYVKDSKTGKITKASQRDIFELLNHNLSTRKKESKLKEYKNKLEEDIKQELDYNTKYRKKLSLKKDLEKFKENLIDRYIKNFDISSIENLKFLKNKKHGFIDLYKNFSLYEKLYTQNLSLKEIIYILNNYSFKDIERNLDSQNFIEKLWERLGQLLQKEINDLLVLEEKEKLLNKLYQKLNEKEIEALKEIIGINLYAWDKYQITNWNEEQLIKIKKFLIDKEDKQLFDKIQTEEKKYNGKLGKLNQKFKNLDNEENFKENYYFMFKLLEQEYNPEEDYNSFHNTIYQLNNLYSLNIIKYKLPNYLEDIFLKNYKINYSKFSEQVYREKNHISNDLCSINGIIPSYV